jgi:HEAT repeat protein
VTVRKAPALVLLVALLLQRSVAAQEAERSTTVIWAESLRYGTDPEVLDTLTRIRDAKERALDADLVRVLGESRSDDVRSRILSYLGEVQSAAGVPVALQILAPLDETPPALLRAAIAYLARLKEERALEDLKSLVGLKDESVAVAAVNAIGSIGGAGSARFLMDVLEKEGEESGPNLRNQIVLALGELGDTEAVDLLLRIAQDRDEERVVRMYAFASLGKIGDTRAVPTLTAALSESDALLRTYAAAALGKLRAPGVSAALLQVLRDSSWQVRVEAARAIADGAAAGVDAGQDLLGMLQYRARRDEVPQVRREAIRALGTLGGASSFDLLRELYGDDKQSPELRAAALTELVRGDLERSVPAITKVVEQEWSAKPDRQKTLEATADQLSKAEAPFLEGLFRRFLQSTNLAVRIYGIRGVARNGLTGFAAELKSAATAAAENAAVRREALAALEKLGLPKP